MIDRKTSWKKPIYRFSPFSDFEIWFNCKKCCFQTGKSDRYGKIQSCQHGSKTVFDLTARNWLSAWLGRIVWCPCVYLLRVSLLHHWVALLATVHFGKASWPTQTVIIIEKSSFSLPFSLKMCLECRHARHMPLSLCGLEKVLTAHIERCMCHWACVVIHKSS